MAQSMVTISASAHTKLMHGHGIIFSLENVETHEIRRFSAQ